MILVRTLLENDVWWYLSRDKDAEAFISTNLDYAWPFEDLAQAQAIIRALSRHIELKRYRFETDELKISK